MPVHSAGLFPYLSKPESHILLLTIWLEMYLTTVAVLDISRKDALGATSLHRKSDPNKKCAALPRSASRYEWPIRLIKCRGSKTGSDGTV